MRQPAIAVHYTGGPVRHDNEVCLIVGYPNSDDRDEDLERLRGIAGDPDTGPWKFDTDFADHNDADLYAPHTAVWTATADLTDPDALVAHPDLLLKLFHSPADYTHGWYTVLRDGRFVEIPPTPDTAPLFDLDTPVAAPTIYEEPTRYTISVLPPDDPWRRHNEINVERYRRTGDQWLVTYGAELADRDGNWRIVDPTDQHIFPLDEALALARRLAPHVSVTGEHTALDVLHMPREGRR